MRRCGNRLSHHVSARAAHCMLHISSGYWRPRGCMYCTLHIACVLVQLVRYVCRMLEVRYVARCMLHHLLQVARCVCSCTLHGLHRMSHVACLHLPGRHDACCMRQGVNLCTLYFKILVFVASAVASVSYFTCCASSCIVHAASCRVPFRREKSAMSPHELVLCCM